MSFFTEFQVIRAVEKLKEGIDQSLSKSQIVNLLVNMREAKRKLDPNEFAVVNTLFLSYNDEKEKKTMNALAYIRVISEMISSFDKIAPFEKYSGMSELKRRTLIEEVKNSEVQIKVTGLVTAVRVSIGDVFSNLCDVTAAILAILSISCTVKFYLEHNAKDNPLYIDISKLYERQIAKICSQDRESEELFLKHIHTLCLDFEVFVKRAKEECGDCEENEVYGIAAAMLYFRLQKKSIELESDERLNAYLGIFKSAFVGIISNL